MTTANRVNNEAQATFRVLAKQALVLRGMSVTGLAQQLGLARNTVSLAINHESMFPSVKKRIQEVLGFT